MGFLQSIFGKKNSSEAPKERPTSTDRDPVGQALMAFAEIAMTGSSKNAPSLVCWKCRKKHVLVQSSFLMSADQAITQLKDAGNIVVSDGSQSTHFTVGELKSFPLETQSGLRQQTAQATAGVVELLKKGTDLSWRCRSCNNDSNKFPTSWDRRA